MSAREVCGDLYEFLRYGPQQLGIALGDVSGKGTAAALYGAVAIGIMRSLSPQKLQPADILKVMNQIIGEGRITIRLRVLPGELWFDVGNSVRTGTHTAGDPDDNPPERKNGAGAKNGIGLRNVVRRLDLLYGSRYTLDLSGTEDSFHVTLKIPLS